MCQIDFAPLLTEIRSTLLNLLQMIAPEADYDSLREDENLREALGIDSFDFLNFAIAVEESLGVQIPEADYGKLVTLNDLVQYIEPQVHPPV